MCQRALSGSTVRRTARSGFPSQIRLASLLGLVYFARMSTITIPLPDEDLNFLRAYSNAQGTSAEAFLARQARNLRQQLQVPLARDVEAASGIISPAINAETNHREHLEQKHK